MRPLGYYVVRLIFIMAYKDNFIILSFQQRPKSDAKRSA